eukprot:TRINITY_DN1550_c0_g3_i1.p1 TRINITY_DN1550_c0_g3~~TRINITY_DN1550_c0_g3_i1.p1  ORF type:complete len:588 (+),score=222.70 TRINITY_DN1550_c0_g3_i1:67-1830(+)
MGSDGTGRSCLACLLPASARGFLAQLREDFGGDFMVMLFCTYFGIKGALYPLSNRAQKIYYLDYARTTAAQYQQFVTFSSTPWALKAVFGAVSDTIPIRGLHKFPYMVAATALGVCAFSSLASIDMEGLLVANDTAAAVNATAPPPQYVVSDLLWLAPVLFFLCNLQISVVDLLTEGRYAAMMVAKPETGSSLVTWVWLSVFSGTLVASCLMGPLSDAFGARLLFAVGIPFSLQVLLPLCKGYLKEERDPEWVARRAGDAPEASCGPVVKTAKVKAQPRMYVLAGYMTLAALANSFSALLMDRTTGLALTWMWCASIIALAFYALPRVLAAAMTYIFLTSALYLAIPGAMDAWYTGDERCVPGGPHFDNTYYLTYSGIVGSVAALGGVTLFQVVFKTSTFRRAFWVTTVLKVAASAFDIVIVNRWHRPHVPDKVMFMFGDAIIGDIVLMLDFMPAVVLISKLCPRGYESLVYAMLGGFQNFGYQVALIMGLYATEALGVEAKPNGDCTWDNLAWLVFIAHAVLPLFTIPLTFVLLPNAKLTDKLAVDIDGAADPDDAVAMTAASDDAGSTSEKLLDAPPNPLEQTSD